MRRRCEKSDSAERVGGRGVLPEEFLEFAKSNRAMQSFQNYLERPVPCEQGVADLRRKRQPAAHAVPCISETAEKSVKYTVFV